MCQIANNNIVMKPKDKYSGISFLLFFIFMFMPYGIVLAQLQNPNPVKHRYDSTSIHSHKTLTMIQFDTVRPTLCTYGKGLPYYEYILRNKDRSYYKKGQDDEKPILLKATFTDIELDILKRNLLFINEQYQYQIQEWIRKDKLDLNLGEMIKGFYMQPVF